MGTATETKRELINVQLLRALAALGVATVHIPGYQLALPWANYGAVGVDIFFVISGFIMVYSSQRFFAVPGGGREFLTRRIIRIVPIYWLASCALWGFYVLNAGNAPVVDWTWMASTLSFIPFGTHNWLPITIIGWTINYEMFFYLCFAIALIWPMRYALPGLTAVFVVFVILWALHLTIGPLTFWFNPTILEFLLGVWLGAAYCAGLRLSSRACWLLSGTGLAIFAALATAGYYYTAADPTGHRWIVWGIPALLIVAGGTLSSKQQRVGMLMAFLVLLGNASYCLYITQSLIIQYSSIWSWGPLLDMVQYLARVFHRTLNEAALDYYASLGRVPVVWATLIASAILIHLYIELPITEYLKRGRRVSDRKATAHPAIRKS